jgi:hypothetical protein
MEKFALLVSVMAELEASLTRTLAVVVVVLGTVQE